MFMAKKKVGIYLDPSLARKLDAVAADFDGQKSELVAAAILMFLGADDDAQRESLRMVMLEKVDRFFDSTGVRVGRSPAASAPPATRPPAQRLAAKHEGTPK